VSRVPAPSRRKAELALLLYELHCPFWIYYVKTPTPFRVKALVPPGSAPIEVSGDDPDADPDELSADPGLGTWRRNDLTLAAGPGDPDLHQAFQ
jgi:hypothetical protein